MFLFFLDVFYVICIQPVWLRLSQELPLLERAGTDTKLLHNRLRRTAVTQDLSQDHLRNIDKQKYEPKSTNLDVKDVHRKTAMSELGRQHVCYLPEPAIPNLLKIVQSVSFEALTFGVCEKKKAHNHAQ